MGKSEKVQFTFHERDRLAQNIFCPRKDVEDGDQTHSRRVQVITDWVSLCSLHTAPNRKAISAVSGDEDADIFPLVCPGTQCLFCLGDVQLPNSARIYAFSRSENLHRHENSSHFRYLDNKPFTCPHPSCDETLENIEQFRSMPPHFTIFLVDDGNLFRFECFSFIII